MQACKRRLKAYVERFIGHEAHLPIYQRSLVSPFSLKKLQDVLTHPYSLLVHQVELVFLGFRCAPQIPPVSFELDKLVTHLFPAGPGSKVVKSGYLTDSVSRVERLDPLIDVLKLVPPVDILIGGLPIVREPDQLWSRKERSNGKGLTAT